MQKITIIGHLGKDYEHKVLDGGSDFYSLSVGVSYGKEPNKKTSWYRVTSGFMSQNLLPYLTKGRKILVHGNLKAEKYTNGSGVTDISLNINLDYLQLLDSKSDQPQEPPQYQQPPTPQSAQPKAGSFTPPAKGNGGNDDDLPF